MHVELQPSVSNVHTAGDFFACLRFVICEKLFATKTVVNAEQPGTLLTYSLSRQLSACRLFVEEAINKKILLRFQCVASSVEEQKNLLVLDASTRKFLINPRGF